MLFGDKTVFKECRQNCCKSSGLPIQKCVLEHLFWIHCEMGKTPAFTGVTGWKDRNTD